MGNRPYTWDESEETHEYDDIIHLPHYVSKTRPHMSPLDRAAQFSPYDALNGYDESISETGRTTDAKGELTDMQRVILSEKLLLLCDLCDQAAHERFEKRARGDAVVEQLPTVTVTFFVPDREINRHSKKIGGAVVRFTGAVRRVDLVERTLTFEKDENGVVRVVKTDDIADIGGDAVGEIDGKYGE